MKIVSSSKPRASRLWATHSIEDLAARSLTALTKIIEAFERRTVRVGDRVAWGQYLDEAHFSESQWGFYGTSSGLQTVAIGARRAAKDARSGRPSEDAVITRVIDLPDDSSTVDDLYDEKVQKGDLRNVVKLAAIAEALFLDAGDNVPRDTTPPLVKELMGKAVNRQYWSTRVDEKERHKERDFATAIVILALKRYQHFRDDELAERAQTWLARRILDDGSFREQTTLLALAALALLPHDIPSETSGISDVDQALDRCRRELLRWIADQQAIVLNRPVFNGFSIGKRNDYVFLHPEILAAIFLIRRQGAKRSRGGIAERGRRFVLDVVSQVVANAIERDGFMGQNGMVSTVDQLWAGRLIVAFRETVESRGVTALIPTPEAYFAPTSVKGRLVWMVALLAAALALSFLVSGWVGLGTGIVGVLLVMFQWLRW